MFFPLVKATFDEENKINVAYKEIGPNFGKRAREGHETGKGRKKMGNEEKGGGEKDKERLITKARNGKGMEGKSYGLRNLERENRGE